MKKRLDIFSIVVCSAVLLAFSCTSLRAAERYKQSSPLSSVVFVTSKKLNHNDALLPTAFKGEGPGFIYDKQGHVVVQASIISDKHSIECSVPALGYWPAVLIGQDSRTGIAVLEIKAPAKILNSLRPVKFTNSSRPVLGQEIIAGGVSPDGKITVLKGICSVPERSLNLGDRTIYSLIQTSIYVYEGFNGAPFFEKSGRLAGAGIIAGHNLPPNMGFAIPASQIRWIVQQIIATGQVKWAWFGASFISIDPSLSTLLDLPADRGIVLVKIQKGSPAEQAGLHGADRSLRLGNRLYPLGGDFIVTIDRTPVTSDGHFVNLINQKGPGAQVLISFYRGKKLKRVKVRLGEKPE